MSETNHQQQMTVTFPDFTAARRAIRSLETAGLEGRAMGFDEGDLQRAARHEQSGGRDERFARRALSKIGLGAVVGGIIGAIIGGLLGWLWLGNGIGVIGVAIPLAAGGAWAGIAMGAIWNQQQSPAYEETFEAPGAECATLHITVVTDDEARLVRHVVREEGGTLEGAAS